MFKKETVSKSSSGEIIGVSLNIDRLNFKTEDECNTYKKKFIAFQEKNYTSISLCKEKEKKVKKDPTFKGTVFRGKGDIKSDMGAKVYFKYELFNVKDTKGIIKYLSDNKSGFDVICIERGEVFRCRVLIPEFEDAKNGYGVYVLCKAIKEDV